MMKKFLSLSLLILSVGFAYAHSGRTDSGGGHNCRTGSCAGTYHYHGGISSYSTPSYTPSYSKTQNCPSNSTYSYLSENCKCNSGYIVDEDLLGNKKCVNGDTLCQKNIGFNSHYDSLSNKCECTYGYELYQGECQSMESLCKEQFGYNSKHSYGTKCGCKYGYEWNSNKTKCVEEVSKFIPSQLDLDSICKNAYGSKSFWGPSSNTCLCFDGSIASQTLCKTEQNKTKCGKFSHEKQKGTCECDNGYVWKSEDPLNLDCIKRREFSYKTSPTSSETECNNKNKVYVNKECLGIPANSYVKKNNWYCNNSYTLSINDEYCIKIPKNAYGTPRSKTDAWLCKEGFTEVGNSCIKKNYNEASVYNNTEKCNSNYSGACVPIATDVDCAGGSGNGPVYVKGPVQVIGRDVYGLDRDGDGQACE